MDYKLPYYMAYPMPLEYDDERKERQDMEYMKSMYPDTVKYILPFVEDECERMEYEGSMIYDEYPDKLSIQLMCSRICDRVNEIGIGQDMDVEMEELLTQMYTPSGTVYDNPYLNWTSEEWNAASDEEKTQCCLAMVQEIQGLSDEDIAALDVNDPSIQNGIQQIKDGLDISFSSGMNVSIGDYLEMIKGQLQ